MKNRKYGLLFGIAVAGVMLLAACYDFFNKPENRPPAESGFGRVSVIIVGEEAGRTVLPAEVVFDGYKYYFTKNEDAETRKEGKPVDGFFTLETGRYKVEVEAYIGTTTKAAAGEAAFEILPATGDLKVKVTLKPDPDGTLTGNNANGFFDYSVTYPKGTTLTITLEKGSEGNKLSPGTGTDKDANNKEKKETVSVPWGSYLLTVKVKKDTDFHCFR